MGSPHIFPIRLGNIDLLDMGRPHLFRRLAPQRQPKWGNWISVRARDQQNPLPHSRTSSSPKKKKKKQASTDSGDLKTRLQYAYKSLFAHQFERECRGADFKQAGLACAFVRRHMLHVHVRVSTAHLRVEFPVRWMSVR